MFFVISDKIREYILSSQENTVACLTQNWNVWRSGTVVFLIVVTFFNICFFKSDVKDNTVSNTRNSFVSFTLVTEISLSLCRFFKHTKGTH